RVPPQKVQQDIRQEQERSRDAGFDTQVSAYLARLLARYNGRDTEAINDHLDAIAGALQGLAQGSIRMLFGGSVAKHTHVDGLSDVDSLVLLSRQDLAGNTPRAMLAAFRDALGQRFPE